MWNLDYSFYFTISKDTEKVLVLKGSDIVYGNDFLKMTLSGCSKKN